MAKLTIVTGTLLVALGIISYIATEMISWTALIPTFFGAVLETCGALALNPKFRKTAMHIAAAVALLGFLGSVQGLTKIGAVIAGDPVERPAAVVAQSIMALITGIFVALCVRSFIAARRSAKII